MFHVRIRSTVLNYLSMQDLCAGQFAYMHLSALELHGSVAQGEEGVIAADADIEAGHELGAALTNDDGAGRHGLTAVCFNASILRVAVPAVPSAALTFLMCHKSPDINTEQTPARFGAG